MNRAECGPLCVALLLATLAVDDHQSMASDGRTPSPAEVMQQQASVIESLQALVTAQQNAISQLTHRLDSLERAQASKQVAFYVDFGAKPWTEANISQSGPTVFNRHLLNVGDGYDSDSGVFRAPVAGLYTFSLQVLGSFWRSGHVELSIVSGQQVLAIAAVEGGKDDNMDSASCTAIVQLQQGDSVHVQRTYGDPHIWGSPLTSFGGMLVAAS